ncbi:uncharacterized protein [Argopecten irradians]|uniref:uncharacterized protein n=1 Tax=Argopecten irradians TaxID=31199 RepID=UPI00371D375D
MEEIYIPDPKSLSLVTKETVDRFTSWAEALSLPVGGPKMGANALRMSVARQVLIKLSRQTSDVNGIFDILGRLVLLIASSYMRCPVRMSDTTLPSLPRPQRQTLKDYETFDQHYIHRLTKKVRLLSNVIVQHRRALEDLNEADKRSQIIRTAVDSLEIVLRTKESELRSLKQRCMSHQASHDEVAAKDHEVRVLQRKIQRKTTLIDGTLVRTDKRNALKKEKQLRAKLLMVYDDVLHDTKQEIIDRLTFGRRCVHQIINRLPADLENRALTIIQGLDLNMTATILLKVSSNVYVYPADVNQCPVDLSNLPRTRILRSESRITTEVDHREEVGQSKSFMCRSNSSADMGSNSEKGHSSSIRRFSTEGYTQRPPSKKYVYVTHTSQIDIPGFLYLNTGMKIKQKIVYEDQEVAFGWYRPHNLATKNWGFYPTRLVSSIPPSNGDHTHFKT